MIGQRKVYHIRELRRSSGMGLKESKDIVEAVCAGIQLPQVLKMVKDGTPKHIIEDTYNRIYQELWEESELIKTNVGRLLYV